ncbi:RodZ family helix-turn-helix domain-containing protein [Parendozoicomonas sp. Alg238-R29]|uniref:RodZ domain-containing protein n=1 Tax=Parendozoicomonas sp. Alg238-R29 TaxID=2993446 RepID=UPI00248F06EC|nr:RodZ family helix-turn-helix domain-containing protein [Parendozoicomonas sp. Alg238-R29]
MTEENFAQSEGSEDNFQRAGQALAEARKNKGLSLEDVSARLKISLPYLRALECCDYDQLPGTAFIRGYLRSYARLVELDETHILGLYGETVQADEQVARLLQEKPLDNHGFPGGKWLAIVSLLLLIAFMAGSVFWWNNQAKPDVPEPVSSLSVPVQELTEAEEPVETVIQAAPEISVQETDIQELAPQIVEEPEIPAVVDVEPVVIEPAVIEPAVIEPVVIEEPAVDTPDIQLSAPVATIEQSQPTEEPLASSGKNELLVRFSNECWVEVRGADGHILFSGLKPANSELTLTGDGPLNIKFGNVDSVAEVVFNGKPVTQDIPASSRGIGRLTLG